MKKSMISFCLVLAAFFFLFVATQSETHAISGENTKPDHRINNFAEFCSTKKISVKAFAKIDEKIGHYRVVFFLKSGDAGYINEHDLLLPYWENPIRSFGGVGLENRKPLIQVGRIVCSDVFGGRNK